MKKADIAMKLSAKLPPMSESQRRYATKHCFDHDEAVRKGDVVHCLECGGTFITDKPRGALNEVLDGYKCPHCGCKLKVVQSKTRYANGETNTTFQVITSIDNVAVVRTWYATKRTHIDTPATYEFKEAHQIFLSDKWGEVVVAHPKLYSWYIDKFDFSRPMAPKRKSRYSYTDIYHERAFVVYPIVRLPQVVIRNGWTKKLMGYSASKAIKQILTNPHYETLAKAERFDLWDYFREDSLEELWPQIRLLLRHDYHPKDVVMWADTVRMARDNGFDTRSPKYILPKNLKKMHDYMVKKDKERRHREEIERMKEKDADYQQAFGFLLAHEIKEKDITIRPLQCAADFIEEGDAMHHCVAMYFERRNSLILSARCGSERLATIELDTKKFKVVQCRARCNEVPARYDEILGIMEAHRKEFVKIASWQKK